MNRERARELLPIIQAFAEGKDIQGRLTDNELWIDVKATDFTLDQYRIKPEPREFWVAAEKRFIDGSIEFSADLYPADRCSRPYDAIKVREVLDDE